MRKDWVLFLTVLLLLCGAPGHSQLQTGSLYGQVVDEEGSPLPGVTVTLMGSSMPLVTVTDQEGKFHFVGLSPDEYWLRAELPGFESQDLGPVTFNIGRNTPIEITLGSTEATTAAEPPPPPPPPEAEPPPPPPSPAPEPPPPPPPPPPMPPPPPPIDGRNYAEIKVFYGTDRLPTGSKIPAQYFGARRSRGGLHLGVCRVSIPRDHRAGEIEQPSIWKLELRPDPSKHVLLLGIDPVSRSTFFQRMGKTLDRSRKREVLVFVHGFNVPFVDAALRTAQMAYDLGLDGVPVLYSWPSQASLAGYKVDENNAEWTIPHLRAFLEDIAGQSGARSIYLIAHSMGNRSLTRALKDIAAKVGNGAKPPFQEILLTAPDIDAEVFADLAHEFRKAGERVTLYASSNDGALNISKKLNGFPRAGDAGPGLVVIPDIDTVDVSGLETGFLGHSYYGDNCSVLADISRLLRDRAAPALRGLDRREKEGRPYWVVRDAAGCRH